MNERSRVIPDRLLSHMGVVGHVIGNYFVHARRFQVGAPVIDMFAVGPMKCVGVILYLELDTHYAPASWARVDFCGERIERRLHQLEPITPLQSLALAAE